MFTQDYRDMAADMGMGVGGQIAADQAFNRADRDGNGLITPNEQPGAYGGYGSGYGAGYGAGYGGNYGHGHGHGHYHHHHHGHY